jgi:GDP-D-mannose 3', 5'-epimerase
MVSVNELASMICAIAGRKLRRRHDSTKPQGVRGRNSDNSRLREVLQWEPKFTLEEGIGATYTWICERLYKEGRLGGPATYRTVAAHA